jgi:hypothetical protein
VTDASTKCADCTVLAERINQLEKRILDKFTDADLRYQQRFDAAEKAVGAALAGADRAVTKAELAYEKRFEAVNEFRASLSDQTATFATKSSLESAISNLLDKIDGATGLSRRFEELGRRVDNFIGRGSGKAEATSSDKQDKQWVVGLWVIGILSLLATAVSLIAMMRR